MSSARGLLVAWLHLSVLWAFAVAQPLFDVLADEPAFFVARGNTRADILALAFALVFLVPTALVAIEALAMALPSLRRALHLCFVGVLIAAVVLQLLHPLSSAVLFPLAAAVGALGAFAYARTRLVPSILTVLAPAPLVFLLLFLLVSPVSKLVLPQGTVGAAAARVSSDTPVVMVVWDEFPVAALMDREGRIDRERFPNFAGLARQSTWYRNATTVADVTSQAVPAILTGQLPARGKLPIASDHPGNLFTLLGRSYSLDVHESATRLCPKELCGEALRPSAWRRFKALGEDLSVVALHQLLPRNLEADLPAVDRTFGDFRRGSPRSGSGAGDPAGALVARDRQFDSFMHDVDRMRPGRQLAFHHAELPHTPSQFLPSGRQYPDTGLGTPGLLFDAVWAKDESLVTEVLQRHLLQQAYVDRLLGDLVRRLKQRGLWDRALVVITADHGIAFQRTVGRRYVDRRNFGEVAGVPYFVKAPGQHVGRVDDSAARTIDLLPTIADYLGVRIPWTTDGHSLLDRPRREPQELTVSRFAGGEVRMPFAEYVRRRDLAVRRITAKVGSHQPADRLFTLGDAGDLVGRRTAQLAVSAGSGVEADLDAPGLYASVDPASRVVPAYVTGRISDAIGLDQRLAVAVNGTIRAVVRPYRWGTQVRFGTVVAPSSFKRGANLVEVFAATGSGSRARLVPLTRGATPRLVRRAGREVMVLPSGAPVPIESSRVDGAIERVTASADGLTVVGWAARRKPSGPADRVLLFADGKLVASAALFTPRPELATRLGAAAQRAGFELRTLREDARELARSRRMRVIATAGGAAAELHPAAVGGAGAGPTG